jgi:hypothetical protein
MNSFMSKQKIKRAILRPRRKRKKKIHTVEGEVPLKPVFFKHAGLIFVLPRRCAIPRESQKLFKILRIEIEKYPIIIRMGMY